jgi:hypothetical protein
MIASPSDVIKERKVSREIIHEWNNIHSFDKKIVLLPIGWETDSAHIMGDRPQGIINKQILEKCDLLIGIFWTRIGTPTGEAISGTVEEIEKHIKTGKPAMLYFSSVPVVPESLDQEQFSKLLQFKEDCKSKGLFESFSTTEEFENKFTRQLQLTINNNDFFKSKSEIDPVENEIINIKYDSESKSLSEEAKTILIEASKDPNGEVMKLSFLGGEFTIQTNRKKLNPDDLPRTKAIWYGAIDELVSHDLIEDIGFKGEIFRITRKGYQYIDNL